MAQAELEPVPEPKRRLFGRAKAPEGPAVVREHEDVPVSPWHRVSAVIRFAVVAVAVAWTCNFGYHYFLHPAGTVSIHPPEFIDHMQRRMSDISQQLIGAFTK